MKNYHNIEKYPFEPKTYTGYAKSNVAIFRITHDDSGRGWKAIRRHCPAGEGVYTGYNTKNTLFYAKTMNEVSDMLSVL